MVGNLSIGKQTKIRSRVTGGGNFQERQETR
jgi:hypothetical protein